MPRIGWPGVRSVEVQPRAGLRWSFRLHFLLSPTVVLPQGPPRSPHNALSNPLQSFSQRSPPPEPWKLERWYGALYRELRALYDHRPTEGRDILAQSGTVPPTTCAVAPRTRHCTQTPIVFPLAGKTVEYIHCERRSAWPDTKTTARFYLTRLAGLIIMKMILWLHVNKSPPGFSKLRKTKADALSHPRLVSFA